MLPDHPIEYVLSTERKDPAARRWILTPQPYTRVLRRNARHEAARQLVASDPPALEALRLDQYAEQFADAVAGTIEPDGTRITDRAALDALRERLDLEAFNELTFAAINEAALKAGAKNWFGSSSSGIATPPTQEPPVSGTR